MGLTPRILETIPELLKRNPSDMVLKFWTSIYCRYLAPRPATMFRNRLCIDGGLTLFMPPTSASETVFFWDSFSLLFECSSSMSLQATFFYRYYKWYFSCPISHKGMCCCSVMFILIWRPGWFYWFMYCRDTWLKVRVCAFPADRLGFKGIAISPHCNPDKRATPRQVCFEVL